MSAIYINKKSKSLLSYFHNGWHSYIINKEPNNFLLRIGIKRRRVLTESGISNDQISMLRCNPNEELFYSKEELKYTFS